MFSVFPWHRDTLARAALTASLFGASPAPLAAPLYVDTGVDYLHDDNIGRAEQDKDILEDHILSLFAAANAPRVLTPHSGLLYLVRFQYDQTFEHEDLSHLTASASATYRNKPSSDYAGTWYEGNLTGALLQHQDSELRDGGLVGLSLSAGRNFTDRIIGRVAYRYEIRRGWNEDVFDTDNHRFSGSLDYRLSERLTFYGTLAWQTGEAVSTATPSPKVLGASEARAADEALSDGTGSQRVAYRLDAESYTGEIGMNIALKQNLAVDLSALHFRAYGKDDNDYDGLLLRGGLLYRF